MKDKKITVLTAVMLVLLSVVASFIIAYYAVSERYEARIAAASETEQKYAKLEEISRLVQKHFIADYDEDAAIESMLAGYVDGLGDKWSGYYTAEQTARIRESSENTYVGIGVTYAVSDAGEYVITALAKGSPALEAGMMINDVVTSVDGKPTSEFETSEDFVAAVRGEDGTRVKITVRRAEKSLELDIKRAKIFNISVEGEMLEGNIGYISITGFESNVDIQFREKLNELCAQGAKGFVFDVRFNGGGYVYVLENMLDLLLPAGPVISTVDKDGKTTEYHSDAACIKMPMAVLVNEYSISAAEFFAAALQEYGVAEVVGDKTGGKGYSQVLYTLSDGSSLNISTSRYYTPHGKSLADTGITPDIEISLSDEDFVNFYYLKNDEDEQLVAAAQSVRTKLQ